MISSQKTCVDKNTNRNKQIYKGIKDEQFYNILELIEGRTTFPATEYSFISWRSVLLVEKTIYLTLSTDIDSNQNIQFSLNISYKTTIFPKKSIDKNTNRNKQIYKGIKDEQFYNILELIEGRTTFPATEYSFKLLNPFFR
jgi:hypothetical protein